jgi:hypothetical protein
MEATVIQSGGAGKGGARRKSAVASPSPANELNRWMNGAFKGGSALRAQHVP